MTHCKPKRALLSVAFMMVLAAILVLALGGCAWWQSHNGTGVTCQVVDALHTACVTLQVTDANGKAVELQLPTRDLVQFAQATEAQRAQLRATGAIPGPCGERK